jgi:hypothetical protein
MDTNMDALSSTLLHMRNQLNDSHRQINLLNEENIRLKTLYQSNIINTNDSTTNGINHTNKYDISQKIKRIHSSNRTTPNNFYNVNETTSSTLDQIMDIDSISLNSINNDNNQHSTSIENGINIIS